MNRYLMVFCQLVGFAFGCPLVNGQGSTGHSISPLPIGSHSNFQSGTQGNFNPGVESVSAVEASQSPQIIVWEGARTHTGEKSGPVVQSGPTPQHAFHPIEVQLGARVGQLHASYSLHRASDNFNCPLKLLHVPFGVWIEIEGSWYQHKSLDNTLDVCVNFEIIPSNLQPSIVVRTASSASEIRQSETSMSKSILLVPGQTVEFDYARDFGEQLRKKLSRSEQENIARMSYADSDNVGYKRMASVSLASRELRPDQISSIQVEQFATSLELSARASEWDVSPKTKTLFTLRGGTRLLSSLAPDVRVRADITTSYVTSSNEKVTKSFTGHIEGTLRQGRVSDANPGKAEIDCVFDFNRFFNGDSELAKYILSARNGGHVECSFANVKLEFYNGLFESAISQKFDGLVLRPFMLNLDLKFPK